MRHKESGWRLGRNTAHRRSLLRNLVTSLIVEERIETTLPKAKAFVELLGSEKLQEEKRQKRAEVRAKRAAEAKKALEEAEAQAQTEGGAPPSEPAEGEETKQ